MFVGKVVEQMALWGLWLANSRECHQLITLFTWVQKFALVELEKTINGDSMRRWLAGSALQVWKKLGHSVVSFVLRLQMSELNHDAVEHMREALDRAERLYQRSISYIHHY